MKVVVGASEVMSPVAWRVVTFVGSCLGSMAGWVCDDRRRSASRIFREWRSGLGWLGAELGYGLVGAGCDAAGLRSVSFGDSFGVRELQDFRGFNFGRFEDRGALAELAGSCGVDAVGGGGVGGLVLDGSCGVTARG